MFLFMTFTFSPILVTIRKLFVWKTHKENRQSCTQGLVVLVADGSGRDVALLGLAPRRSTNVRNGEHFKRTA